MTKNLDENVVRYCLYPTLEDVKNEEFYSNFLNECLIQLMPFMKKYFWYYESFNLNIIKSKFSHNKVIHIEGQTNFDENIEDEWFIVYILFELSKLIKSLIIQINDSDGEFLLIEAADYLPKWLNFKTSENRLFIQNGELKLIPKSFKYKSTLSIKEAIKFIHDFPDQIKCPLEIEQEIKKRIQDYPNKLSTLIHNCFVYVPASVAIILKKDPNLISHAVRKFYSRDDLDLAICRRMKNFPPKDLVKSLVKISKFNYAQLIGQNYIPDSKLGWPYFSQNSEEFKYFDLGIKITCGFEILVASCEQKSCTFSEEYNLSNNKNWKKFLRSLEDNCYFKDLIEGSKTYMNKFEEAKRFFLNSNLTSKENYDLNNEIGQKVLKMKENLKINLNELKLEKNNSKCEDSDDWLNDLPECLKNVDEEKIQNIPKIFEHFLNEKSSYKGVNIDKNKKPNLKEKAFEIMSENLRSILEIKVSESESEKSESDLSDYNYSTASDEESDFAELESLKCNMKEFNLKNDKNIKSNNLNKNSKNKENNGNKKIKNEKDEIIEENNENEEENCLLSENIKDYIKQMDIELQKTNIGKSFEKRNLRNVPIANIDEFSDEENYEQIDIKVNTFKNILESFKTQNGFSGPASNILSSYDLYLPKDDEDST